MTQLTGWMTWPLILVGFGVAAHSADVVDGKDGLKFERRALCVDANECCDIADVNGDGKLDAIVGRNWYAAPDFVSRPLRAIADWNKYVENNGEHALDVNGDGNIDVVAGSFLGKEVYWYENPGPEALKLGLTWPEHLLVDTGASKNEGNYMHDVDGDGVPEFMVDSWDAKNEQLIWKLAKDDKGQPTMTKHVVGPMNGHGFAFGDLNNDGRNDILFQSGWYEGPEGDPLGQEWVLHKDWDLKHFCCPALIVDVDGDGMNDLIWSRAHEYGIFWWQQQKPAADGKLQFKEHLIDDTWSQPHCLTWVDLDGDGANELLTGKRVFAHNGNDPGSSEPPVVYYYKWSPENKSFTRYLVDSGHAGSGLQIRTGDLNGNGHLDILVAGKSGSYILFNQGQ